MIRINPSTHENPSSGYSAALAALQGNPNPKGSDIARLVWWASRASEDVWAETKRDLFCAAAVSPRKPHPADPDGPELGYIPKGTIGLVTLPPVGLPVNRMTKPSGDIVMLRFVPGATFKGEMKPATIKDFLGRDLVHWYAGIVAENAHNLFKIL